MCRFLDAMTLNRMKLGKMILRTNILDRQTQNYGNRIGFRKIIVMHPNNTKWQFGANNKIKQNSAHYHDTQHNGIR